jgi:hypothetical protein
VQPLQRQIREVVRIVVARQARRRRATTGTTRSCDDAIHGLARRIIGLMSTEVR